MKALYHMDMKEDQRFEIVPVGVVGKDDNRTWISVDARYKDGLLGLSGFSHVIVCYWLHRNDTEDGRSVLRVHPRADRSNPLTGVFATHSPVRPNPLGISVCRLVAVDVTSVEIDAIDAFDGSPVIDMKCYIPHDTTDVKLPDWV